MNRQEAITELQKMTCPTDIERQHSVADAVLLKLLRAEGFDDVAQAYEEARDNCGFWYA